MTGGHGYSAQNFVELHRPDPQGSDPDEGGRPHPRVPEESVRRWIRNRALKTTHWGRGLTYYVRLDDLDAFIKGRET